MKLINEDLMQEIKELIKASITVNKHGYHRITPCYVQLALILKKEGLIFSRKIVNEILKSVKIEDISKFDVMLKNLLNDSNTIKGTNLNEWEEYNINEINALSNLNNAYEYKGITATTDDFIKAHELHKELYLPFQIKFFVATLQYVMVENNKNKQKIRQ